MDLRASPIGDSRGDVGYSRIDRFRWAWMRRHSELQCSPGADGRRKKDLLGVTKLGITSLLFMRSNCSAGPRIETDWESAEWRRMREMKSWLRLYMSICARSKFYQCLNYPRCHEVFSTPTPTTI